MNIKKEDFQVYDKHLGNDGGAYKPLGKGTWYNDEMYQKALLKAKNGDLSDVSECHPIMHPANMKRFGECIICGKSKENDDC